MLLITTLLALALGWWVGSHNRPGDSPPYQLRITGEHAAVVETGAD
jgi:hypothetical protein